MFQRASILERTAWWFLMCWIWVIWTAGCGAMLVVQDHEMNARHAIAVKACSDAASSGAGATCMEDRDRWAVQTAGERIPAS
jgi:hypothetical protein